MPRRPVGAGSVIARADGRVAVRLPRDLDPARRWHYGPGRRQRFADVEQAEAWLDAEVRRLRAPPATATADETLGSYLARWWHDHADEWTAERTRIAYRVSLRRWAPIASVRLGDLTREIVQGVVADLRRQRYAPATIRHAVSILHQALEDLVPDVLPFNPARLRRRGRTEQAAEQPVWTAEQADAFLAAAERHEPRYALAFRLVLRRALRIGEIVALLASDVNEQAMTLTVDQTAGLKPGEAGPTKGRRVRDVPLSADLLARIKAHRRDYPTIDPHLFTLDGRPLWIEYLRLAWHRVVRLAGLPPLGPKDGRATCATLLLDAGWPLPRVAQLLGHASVATTARFYARALKRRQDQLVELGESLDRALDGGAGSDSASKVSL